MDRQPLTDRLGDRLLAEYGGAAAAYSLRALNGNGDNVVRVRRASDNDEKDFTAEQIELGEMVNWVTEGSATADGFVETWYDQSGKGNDATQSVTGNQPKIVDGGSLLTNNGNAVVKFNSIDNRHFILGAGIDLTARTVFYAGEPANINFQNLLGNTGDSSANYIRTSNNAGGRVWLTDPSASIFVDGSAYAGGDVSDQGYSLNTFVFDSDATVDRLGGYGGALSDTPIVDASEIIIYDSDQSSNRTGIESNINAHYNIYP